MREPKPKGLSSSSTGAVEGVVITLAVVAAIPIGAYHGGVLVAGKLTGHVPDIRFGDTLRAFTTNPANPVAAYPVAAGVLPAAWLVWLLFGIGVLIVGVIGMWIWSRVGRGGRREGTADVGRLKRVLGVEAVRERAARDRPSLAGVKKLDLRTAAVHLGRDLAGGTELWASHEDSFFVVGPPRSGKTVSVCVPLVLDAPGALVASSTKADLLLVGGMPRRERGAVLVFDPEDISGWPDRLRWSPVTGCGDPATAIRRADAIVAAKPMSGGTSGSGNTGFFTEAAGTVLRCLLHAAALEGRTMRDVVRWASDFGDLEPLDILRGHRDAVTEWAEDLRTYTQGAAIETTSSLKMTLAVVLKSLANPHVLRMCSPPPGQEFDVEGFIRAGGTIFVINSGDVSGSTAPLCTALVDDIVQTGKRLSQATSSGRLDPPLRVVLDEAATGCPLPGLPTYLADSGGRGITTVACVQTFSQARARWGKEEAGQIFGASTVKLVLGGVPEADDLEQLSRLTGERDVPTYSSSRGGKGGGVTVSRSTRRERVFTPTEIRQLPTGQALLLYRTLPPVVVGLRAWMHRPDADHVRRASAQARQLTGGRRDRGTGARRGRRRRRFARRRGRVERGRGSAGRHRRADEHRGGRGRPGRAEPLGLALRRRHRRRRTLVRTAGVRGLAQPAVLVGLRAAGPAVLVPAPGRGRGADRADGVLAVRLLWTGHGERRHARLARAVAVGLPGPPAGPLGLAALPRRQALRPGVGGPAHRRRLRRVRAGHHVAVMTRLRCGAREAPQRVTARFSVPRRW
ncbi:MULTISPECIES: type IV secretory system conjugative DNA transfer family protein [Saccharothrix]|uniref:type IV secretory system conjugative DNA transfer family protein n=1 Tax=Saccharothrix TaxID=2071 RepID=UPI00116120AA|nr:type IV secretory system conjugative DNA transfer family protein [Saccharothrix sp. CB00851]